MREMNLRKKECFFLCFLVLLCTDARAAVTLRVKAVNPLEEITTEVIRYPLPIGIKPENIKGFKIEGYYQEPEFIKPEEHEDSFEVPFKEPLDEELEFDQDIPPSEESEINLPPEYHVVFDEAENLFFLEVKVIFPPKGVVNLEINIEDVWTVSEERLKVLASSVPELLEENQTGLSLREIIFEQLDEITERQSQTSIAQVGVEDHIEAYEKNIQILEQAELDVGMLENLIMEEKERIEKEQAR